MEENVEKVRESLIFLLLAVLVVFTTSIGLWWLGALIVMLQIQVTIEAYRTQFFYIRLIGTIVSLLLFLWFLWESVNFLFFLLT